MGGFPLGKFNPTAKRGLKKKIRRDESRSNLETQPTRNPCPASLRTQISLAAAAEFGGMGKKRSRRLAEPQAGHASTSAPNSRRRRRSEKQKKQEGPTTKKKIVPPTRRILYRPFTQEELDAKFTFYVDHALDYYNANHPGMEYEAANRFMAYCTMFRSEIWHHVNFLACRRDDPEDGPAQRFFAEMRGIAMPTVESCIILENQLQHIQSNCTFCPESFEISHPDKGFICGRKGQKLNRLMNFLKIATGYEQGGVFHPIEGIRQFTSTCSKETAAYM